MPLFIDCNLLWCDGWMKLDSWCRNRFAHRDKRRSERSISLDRSVSRSTSIPPSLDKDDTRSTLTSESFWHKHVPFGHVLAPSVSSFPFPITLFHTFTVCWFFFFCTTDFFFRSLFWLHLSLIPLLYSNEIYLISLESTSLWISSVRPLSQLLLRLHHHHPWHSYIIVTCTACK